MIDEQRILMQVAREIAYTLMPRGLSPEAAEAEVQRTYEYLMNEETGPDAPEVADGPETGLLKEPYILPILAEWMEQAEEADRRKKEAAGL
ncbi:hypothetical protein ACRAWG_00375 [Methylobacterium sp. P31]